MAGDPPAAERPPAHPVGAVHDAGLICMALGAANAAAGTGVWLFVAFQLLARGLSWSARPDGKEELEPGTVCVIRRLEGVTLYVAAEEKNTGNGTAGIPGENQEKT